MGESTASIGCVGDGAYVVEVEGVEVSLNYIRGEQSAVALAKELGRIHSGRVVRVYVLRETHYFHPKWPKGVVNQ